ncbi:MAG: hypothetical protein JNM63_03090, partial [Spirochaetia bacterium]|nr:hypothetical protein [Spirochaetia bacterium]
MKKHKKLILGMLFACSLIQAEELGVEGWAPSGDKSDFEFKKTSNSLFLKRTKPGYYLRLYRDFPVEAGGRYEFSTRIKVEGGGNASISILLGGTDGVWDEKNPVRSEKKITSKDDERESRVVFNVPANSVKARINIALEGADSSGRFSALRLEKKFSQGISGIPSISGTVDIDGVPNEEFWKQSLELNGFRILGEPDRAAALKTSVYLAAKNGELFIACRGEEPDPSGMTTRCTSNDSSVTRDDAFEIFLSLDKKAYSHIGVNAKGFHFWTKNRYVHQKTVWYPTLQIPTSSYDWDARAQVGKNEWSAEFRLKLSDLFEDNLSGDQTLYVNFSRHRNAGTEPYVNWAGLSGKSLHSPKDL